MPKIIGDQMVELTQEDKTLIREIGYQEVADMLGLTAPYIRSLCSSSKDPQVKRKMRESHINLIRQGG